MDLWGPKKVENVNGYTYEVHVLSMVDPTTGWVEFCQLYGTPTAYRVQQILDSVWLSRYPRPKEIGMDNGSEFKGVFLDLCSNRGLKPKRSLPWNPQANSILERIHQVLGDGMRVFDLENTRIDPDEDDPFDEYLSSVSYAIRSSYHQTHGHSPAELVFGRNMFIDAKAEIDWTEIRERKQKKIRKSNERENAGRIDHTYKKGDMIIIKRPGIIRKLSIPYSGPYKVTRHNKNGSITYEKSLNVYETVNLRRAYPFYEEASTSTANIE